jgi:hypothetical protein
MHFNNKFAIKFSCTIIAHENKNVYQKAEFWYMRGASCAIMAHEEKCRKDRWGATSL